MNPELTERTPTVEELQKALEACCGILSMHEYPGSREASDFFVTIAMMSMGSVNDACIRILERGTRKPKWEPLPGQQAHHYFCPLCGGSRLWEKAMGILGCPMCDAEFIPTVTPDEKYFELTWIAEIDTTVTIAQENQP